MAGVSVRAGRGRWGRSPGLGADAPPAVSVGPEADVLEDRPADAPTGREAVLVVEREVNAPVKTSSPLTLTSPWVNKSKHMNVSTRNRKAAIEGVDFDALRRMLAALSDPTRQQIVAVLSRERLNVTQLTERFSLSQPAISHHLRILSSAGLLVQERHGRERVYRLDTKCCQGLADQFRNFMSQCCANAKCC